MKLALRDATKALTQQGAQLNDLVRLVKGLNASGAALDPDRQKRMVANLSSDLYTAQRAGNNKSRQTVEELADQFDALRDQISANLGRESSADATRMALKGLIGDSISNLELRSASRQLDDIQTKLGAIQSDVRDVKAGVHEANAKLDRIQESVDPALAADRCPDLECAIENGATSKAIKRLLERGAKVQVDALHAGGLLRMAAVSREATRLETIDLLFQHGINPNLQFFAYYTAPGDVSAQGFRWAKAIYQVVAALRKPSTSFGSYSPWPPELKDWNEAMSCFQRASGGVNILELAGLLGDRDLSSHLIREGVTLPERPLICREPVVDFRMNVKSYSPSVRVDFNRVTGQVIGISTE